MSVVLDCRGLDIINACVPYHYDSRFIRSPQMANYKRKTRKKKKPMPKKGGKC